MVNRSAGSDEVAIEKAIPTLRVTDVRIALPTYSALGFTVEWEHQLSPEAPRLTCVSRGAVELFLTEHPVAAFKAVVYFATRGVDALVLQAAAAEIHPMFGPEDRPWGDREVYFRDPDSNVLRFGESIL